MHSEANQRWKNPVEEFRQSNSYKELLGTDGEPIEFELNFPRTYFIGDLPKDPTANQLSIHGAVSSWCEEFAQKTPNQKESTSEKFVAKENEQLLKNVKPHHVNSLVQTSNE